MDSHSACRIDSKMYIFGGSTDDEIFNELWSFDLHSHIWKKIEQKGNIPSARESHSVAVFENYMCLIGGWNSETEHFFE